jgi:hypothetical protein
MAAVAVAQLIYLHVIPFYSFSAPIYYKIPMSLLCTAETRTPHCNRSHLLLYCVTIRSHLHISLASYRPSPSITVSSDPRLVYVYTHVLALVYCTL